MSKVLLERQDDETLILNFGPQHPAMHGTLRVVLRLDGESIVEADPIIGYLHSGFEKVAERMTYNQYVVVTDRMNYLSPIANNIAFHSAVEKLLGIEITERCKYLRVILAELSRIADHLVCVGTATLDSGAFTAFLWAFREREHCYDLFELASGARYTNSWTRVGGLMRDVPDEFLSATKQFCETFPRMLDEYEDLITNNPIWLERTKRIGVMGKEEALDWGWSGPIARASGVDWDLRRDQPYLVYDRLQFDVPTGTAGDAYERYLIRVREMRQSIRIIEQCLDDLPSGPVNVAPEMKVTLPDKEAVYTQIEALIHHFEMIVPTRGFSVPVGEVYCANETANGELGFYLVSDGTAKCFRMRVRPPSFINYQCFGKMLKGYMISDIVIILGSLNIIAAELDR